MWYTMKRQMISGLNNNALDVRLNFGGVIQMKPIPRFLDKYSNVLTVCFTCLITLATFFIWDVSRQQTKYTYLMGKAAHRPIIQTDYIDEYLHNFNRRHELGDMAGKGMEIRTIRITNIGTGYARNVRIEQRGRETEKIPLLSVGQTHEYFIQRKSIKSGEVWPFVTVTYQDIFENEFTTGY